MREPYYTMRAAASSKQKARPVKSGAEFFSSAHAGILGAGVQNDHQWPALCWRSMPATQGRPLFFAGRMPLAKRARKGYLKREPRPAAGTAGRGWHGAVCAPVHGCLQINSFSTPTRLQRAGVNRY